MFAGSWHASPTALAKVSCISVPFELTTPLNTQLENPRTGEALATSDEEVGVKILAAAFPGKTVLERRVIVSPEDNCPDAEVANPKVMV